THDNPDIRSTALNALGRWWPDRPEALDTILHATTHDDPRVRHTALNALGTWWPDRPEALDTILHATTHDNPDIRRTALNVLGERWPDRPGVFDTILNATTHDNPDIRRTAVRVLAHRYTDRACRVLIELAAREDDDDLRADVVKTIASVWPDEADVPQFLKDSAAADTSEVVRTTARQALAFLELRSRLDIEQEAPASR
ncbi:HEAT repeat domain-containing protein, partial [Streptomyces microflavus]|uniref:HEAT repeat domain-containing protein n=1 Tax=Streptomyces microflavus TaxID=1919 RepID=UPI00366445BD